MSMKKKVKSFWDLTPLCSLAIGEKAGSKEFFRKFDALRESIEPPLFGLYGFNRYNGKKVLDVGCGNGWVLSKYAKCGARVSGIDISDTAVRISKKRFKLFGLKGEFFVGDAENLPFPADTFDAVTSMGVLHHTPDTKKAVNEIHRVLKPGSRALIMLYHKNSFLYWVYYPVLRVLRKEHRGKSLDEMVCLFDGADNPLGKAYSRKEAASLCSRFKRIKITTRYFSKEHIPLPLSVTKYLVPQRLLDFFARKVGWYIYIECFK